MGRKKTTQAKNTTKSRQDIVESALKCAENAPWEFVAPYDIAVGAGVSLDQLYAVFPTKGDILADIIATLDADVVKNIGPVDDTTPLRDRLFDVLMERFDIANRHRGAHLSFLKSFGWTKADSCHDVTLLKDSMRCMAECAGMDVGGIFGRVRLSGLCVLYMWVVCTWARDTSPDLTKTMAELDKSLRRAEWLAAYCGLTKDHII